MFDGGGKPYPVVYCDGERDFDLGILMVDPTMNIKNILSILSHKIGISPHQFSVFIADRNSNQKIPFTAKLNLATMLCDGGDDYIYVKRSGRSKKSLMKNRNLSEKLMHLRRDGVFDRSRSAYVVAPSHFERGEIERTQRRMLNLCKEREAAFLMSMEDTVEGLRRGAPVGKGGESGCAVCRECLKAEVAETDADFHLCVLDEVVVGFRTAAGPISRPVRNSGDNGQ
ncbi:uncharacterized protein LOC131639114 [Vicia villosa]|uniref:uncharacterized protein LOC131639114 n=1 Tax=Vicia villosa TaxID=3911 RepID=UPI00273C4DD2|nr:uncharacterized protein LOC131639114 [Vicia villosa]